MVDNEGYLTPIYAAQPPPVDVITCHNIKKSQSPTATKNSAVLTTPPRLNHEALSNVVYCRNCDLNYIDADEYEKHTKNKCMKKHICTYCSATFQRNDHLKRHIISVHQNSKYNICPACNEDCKRYDLLLKHIESHPNESMVNCRNCKQEFKSLNELVVHESTHVWPDGHICSYCSKVFKRRDHMLRHVQTLHLQQHTKCPICSQKFKRKDHALRHIREKHRMAIPNGGLKEFQEKFTIIPQ